MCRIALKGTKDLAGCWQVMVGVSGLRRAADIAADELKNSGVQAEYDRTAFADAVAIRVIRYRAEHGLSQTALAKNLGMRQPAIARPAGTWPRLGLQHRHHPG